jgi:hypothetical protein
MRSAERGELENCKAATTTTTTKESLVTGPETYLCIFFVNVVVFFASSVPQTKTKKKNERKRERERENRSNNSNQQTNKPVCLMRSAGGGRGTAKQHHHQKRVFHRSMEDLGTAASASCVSQLHM